MRREEIREGLFELGDSVRVIVAVNLSSSIFPQGGHYPFYLLLDRWKGERVTGGQVCLEGALDMDALQVVIEAAVLLGQPGDSGS